MLEAAHGKRTVQLAIVPDAKPVPNPTGANQHTSEDTRNDCGQPDSMPVRTAQQLRSINRAPDSVKEAYREGRISQTLAAKLGPKNPKRRHLTAPQRAVLAVQVAELMAGEAAERKLAGQKKGGAVKNGKAEKVLEGSKVPQPQPAKTVAKAAKAAGAGEKQVQAMTAVKKAAPEVFKAVQSGAVSSNTPTPSTPFPGRDCKCGFRVYSPFQHAHAQHAVPRGLPRRLTIRGLGGRFASGSRSSD